MARAERLYVYSKAISCRIKVYKMMITVVILCHFYAACLKNMPNVVILNVLLYIIIASVHRAIETAVQLFAVSAMKDSKSTYF